MKSYPFAVIPVPIVTSSTSPWADTTNAATLAASASVALFGRQGDTGPLGQCIYISGSIGLQGPQGAAGAVGTNSSVIPYTGGGTTTTTTTTSTTTTTTTVACLNPGQPCIYNEQCCSLVCLEFGTCGEFD